MVAIAEAEIHQIVNDGVRVPVTISLHVPRRPARQSNFFSLAVPCHWICTAPYHVKAGRPRFMGPYYIPIK